MKNNIFASLTVGIIALQLSIRLLIKIWNTIIFTKMILILI